MPVRTIDLNCDLGEEPGAWGRDLELLDLVTSANLACGGHAGDEDSMRRALRAASERGVAIGAHPSYPDREHFGRRDLELDPEALAETVTEQVGALRSIAHQIGAALHHVKPHGALYNRAASDPVVAAAIARGVGRVDPRLPLVGLAGSTSLVVWGRLGFRAVAEAFADRRYEADGSLRSRAHADAVIADPAVAAAQAVRIARDGWVADALGGRLALAAATLCVHSDTPGSPAVAYGLRSALREAGVEVASF